ncbi:hypothetical protein E2542_SST00977 [Spatholobus suberectus]|nr:hypothetical protein E2542_SST00977 [Spatholobus suberectus]
MIWSRERVESENCGQLALGGGMVLARLHHEHCSRKVHNPIRYMFVAYMDMTREPRTRKSVWRGTKTTHRFVLGITRICGRRGSESWRADGVTTVVAMWSQISKSLTLQLQLQL